MKNNNEMPMMYPQMPMNGQRMSKYLYINHLFNLKTNYNKTYFIFMYIYVFL